MIQIIQKLIPVGTLRRSGIKNLGIKYIVCHDTGNDGSTANGNINYYIQSANEQSASAHFFVDNLQILNCIPEDEKAWHVRKDTGILPNVAPTLANDVSLGIELCFGSAWGNNNIIAYNNYTDLIASLCQKYRLDPKMALVAHSKLDPTRRTDPLNAFKYIGKTWDQFILDVVAKMTPTTPAVPVNKDAIKAQIKVLVDML